MLLAAVLLITTTIRLSALSRKRETGIMRLVGASTVFIQLPFMLEGAIAATIGALLAVGGLWVGVTYLVDDWLGESAGWIPYVSTADVLTIAPAAHRDRHPARRDLLAGHPQPLHEGVT